VRRSAIACAACAACTFSSAARAAPAEAVDPGYFNGIGVEGRSWEIRSESGLGEHRVLTQRFEVARAFQLSRYALLYLVPRVSFGFAGSLAEDTWVVQGPLFSIGLRQRSMRGRYWAELGVRLIPNYSGPHDADPVAHRIAFDAAQTSGVGDDAMWLPFSAFGAQMYVAFQTRTAELGCWSTAIAGAEYGARLSLGPMGVRTWLGPQGATVGSFWVEPFVTTRRLLGSRVNLQWGVHAEASLSSIWPGERSMPLHLAGFVGWSPTQWFALRLSGGGATAPLDMKTASQALFGIRAQVFAP